jgi:hypothetical protein
MIKFYQRKNGGTSPSLGRLEFRVGLGFVFAKAF